MRLCANQSARISKQDRVLAVAGGLAAVKPRRPVQGGREALLSRVT